MEFEYSISEYQNSGDKQLENTLHPRGWSLFLNATRVISAIADYESNRHRKDDSGESFIDDYLCIISARESLNLDLEKNTIELAATAGGAVSFFGLHDISYHSLVLQLVDRWIVNFTIKTMQLNGHSFTPDITFPNELEDLAKIPINMVPKIESGLRDELDSLRLALKSEACRLSSLLKSTNTAEAPKIYIDDLNENEAKVIDYLKRTREYQTGAQIAQAIKIQNNSHFRGQLSNLVDRGLIEKMPKHKGYAITKRGKEIDIKPEVLG